MTTEEQVKCLSKMIIDNKDKQLTSEEKEIIKHTIDQAATPQQLLEVVLASRLFVR